MSNRHLILQNALGLAKQGVIGLVAVLALSCVIPTWGSSEPAPSSTGLMEHMRAAYARIEEYQVDMEVRTLEKGDSYDTEKFVYSFKRPDHVRLDLAVPHTGMVVIYPDREGKVLVKRREASRFLSLRLPPDSRLLRGYPGHRIDQSDMGRLIENIARSLTDEQRGPIEMSEKDGSVLLRVLAVDHFRPDRSTLYEFLIDAATWLPTGVTEMTPEGEVVRMTSFTNLRVNPRLPAGFFDTDPVRDSEREGNAR